jgi:hypothetical protein
MTLRTSKILSQSCLVQVFKSCEQRLGKTHARDVGISSYHVFLFMGCLPAPQSSFFLTQEFESFMRATTCTYTSITNLSSVRMISVTSIFNSRLSGFPSGVNSDWGNLCSCIHTVIRTIRGFRTFFRPRNSVAGVELIEWDLEKRESFGNWKAFDFLGLCASV